MPIRVGLIGAGNIAARHAAAYKKHQSVIRLSAVADIAEDRAAALAENSRAAVYRDYLEMLADADVDAIDICLPHHLHAPAILAAARYRKHILCEKPLCLSLDEAEQIAVAVEDAGVTLMCAHNRLFSPVATKARELLSGGLLGWLYEVRSTDCFVNEADPGVLGWRARLATCGGGELIDTGYHPAYLILALASGTPTEVLAMTSRHRLSFMEGEDSAQVLVRFDNGVVGHIATSWAYQAPESHEHFSAAGERGTLHSSRTHLTYRLNGQGPVTFAFPKGDGIAAGIAHFADCVANGSRPLHTHREGTEVLAMIVAAYESVRTRSVAPVRLSSRQVAAR